MNRTLLTLLCLGAFVLPTHAQYRSSHPRLPGPDAAFLQALQNDPGALTANTNLANALDVTGTSVNHHRIRAAIIAWKLNPNPVYLTKLEAIATHPLTYYSPGTKLYVLSIIYDWMYDDLSPTARTQFQQRILGELQTWQYNFDVYPRYSPFNSTGYNRLSAGLVWGTIAIHPDVPESQNWVVYTADILVNRWLPVWRKYMREGGWHEGAEYRAYIGRTVFLALYAAGHAVNRDLFAEESWCEWSLYYPYYAQRPDGTPLRRGDVAGWHTYKAYPSWGSYPDIPALAVAYNNPHGLHIATAGLGTNSSYFGPAKPTHFPWGPPMPANPVMAGTEELPTDWWFKGISTMVMRSDWSEDAVYADFGVDPGCWSHSGLDSGHFSIYRRGGLAIDSGAYGAGAVTEHWRMYGSSAAAHNVMLFKDNLDQSSSGQLNVLVSPNNYNLVTAPNDGGMHRHRSGWNGVTLPYSLAEREQRAAEFDYGTMQVTEFHPDFAYARADLAAAYNETPTNDAAHIRRTDRLNGYERIFVYLRPDVFVILDRFELLRSDIIPSWRLHTINQPSINGNRAVAMRTEAVYHQYAWNAGLQYRLSDPHYYQYDGKMVLTSLLPAGANLGTVGGSGSEFQISGVNYDGYAQNPQYMNPDPTDGPAEPGSWRIQISRGGATQPLQDVYLNVVQAATSQDEEYPVNNLTTTGGAVGAEIRTGALQSFAAVFSQGAPFTAPFSFTLSAAGSVRCILTDLVPHQDYQIMITTAPGIGPVPVTRTANRNGIIWTPATVTAGTTVTVSPAP